MQSTVKKYLLFIATIAVLAMPGIAQEQPLIIRSLMRFTVMPGRTGDFRAAAKEFNEVLEKAGYNRAYTLWLSGSGPNSYVAASYATHYGDFDAPSEQDPKLKDYVGQLAPIVARFDNCVESQERVIEEVQRELSTFGPDTPNLIRVLRFVVKPDRVDDFLALVKSDVLPAARQSGLKMYQVSRTRYGGVSNEFRSTAGWDKWADFDGLPAVQKAMGPEKYAEYQRKLTPMIVESQSDIYRYQPDLSYIPARTTITSNR
jgi:quinol monooxygenase YgiN